MNETKPWFKFYPEDFRLGVAGLSEEAIGVYILLLGVQWKCGSIPTDYKVLSRMSGVHSRVLSRLLQGPLKNKFNLVGETLVNKRLEVEREIAVRQSDMSRKHGKLGGRPKTQRVTDPEPYIEIEKSKRTETYKDLSDKKSDHSRAVKYFCEAYETKFGHKYDFKRAKDGALVKRLLNTYEISGFEKMVDQLFKSTDSFIETTDRGIAVLSACSTKLMQETESKTRDIMDSKRKEAFNRIQFCEATGRIDEHQAAVFRKELHNDLTTSDEMLAKLHDQRIAE